MIQARSPYAEPGERVPVLVLGVGITALAAMRCLGRRRIPLYVGGATDDLVTSSRWYRPLPGKPLSDPSAEELRAALAASGIERAVLLPCADLWATVVSGLQAECGESFPASIAPPDVIRKFIDKSVFAQTLVEHRVPHPRTIVLNDAADLDRLPEGGGPDFFIKPTRSRPFARKYGVKGMRLKSPEQARALLDEVRGMGIGIMLQEFIPGPATRHCFVEGFVDRHGRICGMLARRRLRMYPREFGNSTATVTIPLSDVQAAADTMRRLLAAISYRGIFSAEFKLDERDGQYKILEVNARPWWYVEFASRCGMDVCHMAYRDARGLEVEAVSEYRTGRRCVYSRMDVRGRLGQPRADRPGLLSLLLSPLGADQLTYCRDDPLPGVRELFWWARSRLKKRLRL